MSAIDVAAAAAGRAATSTAANSEALSGMGVTSPRTIPPGRFGLQAENSGPSGVEADREAAGRAEGETRDGGYGLGRVEAQVSQTVDDRRQADSRLELGEVVAEAEVASEGEGQVVLRPPVEVESVRVVEVGLVAVGGADDRGDHHVRRDGHAGDLDRPRGLPRDEHDRRLPAERLLDGPRHESAVGVDARQALLPVDEQR